MHSNDTYLIGKGQAWFAFAMTIGLMLVDYIDRQVIVSLFPYMKLEWALSDKQLGALVSVVSVTVALGALPVALLADRYSRVKSIVVMATVWSLATISCMFTRNYAQMLTARAFVGMGEAGYGSVGAALIASIFPARMRSVLLAAFFAAASVGSVLGVMLGGLIAATWGWKAAFGVVGIPGLVLALAVPEGARLPHRRPDAGTRPRNPLDRPHREVHRGGAGALADDALGMPRRRRATRGGLGGVVVAAELPQPRARRCAGPRCGRGRAGGAVRRARQPGLGRRGRPCRQAPSAQQAAGDDRDVPGRPRRADADLRRDRLRSRRAPSSR